MSDGFKQADTEIKDLKVCPECSSDIKQDIFVIDYGRKKKRGENGLTECRACFKCKVIYEVIS
jgi:hypothetical protein